MLVETTATENAAYAPTLGQFAYAAGGTFYWRVAAADDSFANIGDFTATRSFVLAALGVATKTATITTASVTRTRAVRVRGAVSPSHPGDRVLVTLFRKRNGAFAKVAAKWSLLGSASGYTAKFRRPRPGACRVISRFPGDADHRASARSVTFRC
jgi:hypothetical protein